MLASLDCSSGIDPHLIEEQVRFMLANKISLAPGSALGQEKNIPRCPKLSKAKCGEWAQGNIVANAILRIEMVRRGGRSAEAGRRKKYLHFPYNGEVYIPPWQFAKDGKLLPLVKKIVKLYQQGSDDPDGLLPIKEAWSSFYVVSRVEEVIKEYTTCHSPKSRIECAKRLVQKTKRNIEPGGW